MFLTLVFAARSDVGLLRTTNQDSAFAGSHLLVVADGMGGAAGGDIASSIAVGTLAALDEEAFGQDEALDALKDAIARAHADIVARAHNDPQLSGLGTTVTAILRAGSTIAMAHIGDSRGYLLRDGVLDQVTTDHSFVQHLVDTGRLSASDAEHHPKRSMLLRVLGDVDADVPVDISARETRVGDRWLLCSDGLSNIVSRSTLAKVLRAVSSPSECADQLLALALSGGAPDNVTCIVADVVDVEKPTRSTSSSAASQIVGAAAVKNDAAPVTPARERTATKPASKAAALTGKNKEGTTQSGEPSSTRKRFQIRPWMYPAVGFFLLFSCSFAGYAWTQGQYYVGNHDGVVAIYRGIPQSLGPIHLSSLVTDETGITMNELAPYERDRIQSTIRRSSLEGAWGVVDALGSAN
jgi:PPM family protein phosphatase